MLIVIVELILIVIDILGIIDLNSSVIVIALAMSVLFVSFRYFRLHSSIAFIISIMFLALLPLFMLLELIFVAEKLALWSFLLMIIGVVLGFTESDDNKDTTSVAQLVQNSRKWLSQSR